MSKLKKKLQSNKISFKEKMFLLPAMVAALEDDTTANIKYNNTLSLILPKYNFIYLFSFMSNIINNIFVFHSLIDVLQIQPIR